MEETQKCWRCKRELSIQDFYKHKDGKIDHVCKECLIADVKDNDPISFLGLLRRFDIPYIEKEWAVLVERQKIKAVEKGEYHTIFGKYLSKMKLKGWKGYTFEDSAELNQRMNHNKIYFDFDNLNRKYKLILEDYIDLLGYKLVLKEKENDK